MGSVPIYFLFILLGPTAELGLDRRRGAELRQGARLLRLLLALPFGHQVVGLGEGVLEAAAGGQRFLEEGAAEVGELGAVGAAEGRAVVARRGDDEGAVVAQRVDEAARVARRDDDHLPADAARPQHAAELARRQVAQRDARLVELELVRRRAV